MLVDLRGLRGLRGLREDLRWCFFEEPEPERDWLPE